MNYKVSTIFNGFPGKSSRGFLGWSSVYLITIYGLTKSDDKYLLFDTGGFNERLELLQRLNDLGLLPEDVDGVFLSHLHYDHCVNWVLFPNAKIFVSEKELEVNYRLKDLLVPEFHIEKLKESSNVEIVNERDNVFGFNVISLPGHTRGLIGLELDSVYFVSDAIKNRDELLTGKFLNVLDQKESLKTLKKIKRKANIIYPGHDIKLEKENGVWNVECSNYESIHINKNSNKFSYGMKLQIIKGD